MKVTNEEITKIEFAGLSSAFSYKRDMTEAELKAHYERIKGLSRK